MGCSCKRWYRCISSTYNPLIDDAVKAEWNIPASWNLRAQMPFGNIVQEAGEKEFIDDADRFRVFK